MRNKKIIRRVLILSLVLFIVMNLIAYFHAYKFTHFDPTITIKTKNAKELTIGQKIKTLFFGINNPRPRLKKKPDQEYSTIKLKSNKEIECWYIKIKKPKGTVAIFHGYSGEKSSMLDKAEIFTDLGYNTLLVDFMGSGGSYGDQTTIGFYEAVQVKTAFEYLKDQGEKNVVLFGTSMGAAAIMRAQSDYSLTVNSIIIECPFGTMLQTVEARFKTMNAPAFPMANLLVFWGGVQNEFDAFSHNPIDYAKNIHCPTLLLYGLKDQEVSQQETLDILKNLSGERSLALYPLAGHENYLRKYKEKWTTDVCLFLNRYNTKDCKRFE